MLVTLASNILNKLHTMNEFNTGDLCIVNNMNAGCSNINGYLGISTNAMLICIRRCDESHYYEMLSHSYNHDILGLSLRIDRLVNSLKDAKKEENYTRAEELIKKLSNFRTVKTVEPLMKRLKRAYYLFKTI